MEVSEIFGALLENLKVGDASATIAMRRDEITKALNKDFRSIDGVTSHRLMVGSYGRHTAIRGVSDLDMIFILPSSLRDTYSSETGPRRILTRVKDALTARYPNTDIRVDQCVVRVQFTSNKFKFEIQPPSRTMTAASTIRIPRQRAGRIPSHALRSAQPKSATTEPQRTCAI